MAPVVFGARTRRWRRRCLRTSLVLVVTVVLVVGGYIAYVAVRANQPVTLPAPTGRYPVGRTLFDWTDRARIDPLAPRPGVRRELSVWLWYPASPGPHPQHAVYAPGAWAGLHLNGVAGVAETSFDDVHNHAWADATAATGRFPLVVLAPGMGFAAPQYTALAENLASHGYLVAGVTPTYSANLTILDGRAVSATKAGDPPAFDAINLHTGQAQAAGDRLVDVWASDERFVAAKIASLNKTGPLAGRIAAGVTVYLGHSFGGAAALEACGSDPRCVGAVDLDGTQYGPVVHSGLDRPMLLMGSQNSCVTGVCRPANTADRADLETARALLSASGPAWCYQISGAEHFNFSDYGSYYLAAPIRSQLALGSVNGPDALTITGAYLTAFVDHVTQGLHEPLLTDRSSPYPEIDVQRIGS